VINMLRRRYSVPSILGFAALVISASPIAVAIERLAVGDSVRVACETAPVYGMPSAFGMPSSGIAFGETVRINSLAGSFELPESDYSSKKKLEQQAQSMAGEGTPRKIEAEEYTRHSWAEVGSSQFVPTSCLVSEKNFGDQTIERAEEKVADLASGKAKRNFSEDEDEGDLRAVRGAAGGAKGGAADYDKVDRLIVQAQGVDDPSMLSAFRKAGGLGEYK